MKLLLVSANAYHGTHTFSLTILNPLTTLKLVCVSTHTIIQNKEIFVVQWKEAPNTIQVDSPACNKSLSTSTTVQLQKVNDKQEIKSRFWLVL